MHHASLTWDLALPFTVDFSVKAEHIDFIGHVNNAVYVDWCQQAGWQHSLKLGLGFDEYKRLDAAMVIRRADYDYVLSAYVGEECIMGTWLTANDHKLTMERQFQLLRKSDGKTLLRGHWQLVCIRMSSGRPRRMPIEFDEGYGAAVVTTAV
ncbi:acyl-CoA thioesterase [Zhongshania sp. BJYM1]|uniref:acyl-CoA thioesterase n=1 Tax=Zhongshania aquatica TaxID=2965069 RepID=UPI0022B3C77C|nr:acyl-CoA thioesterase [Marortus sp. BJYM1]